jgi:thioredoxin reductase
MLMIMFIDGRSPTSPIRTDVGIVGCGPAGLFAAYYAGLRNLSTTLVDSLPQPGGQVAALYPHKVIYDVAAHPAISGQGLVDALLAQVEPMPAQMLHGHTVTDLRPAQAGGWRLLTDNGTAVECQAVVVSAGAGSSTPRRLACADGHLDRGVFYTTVAPEQARGRDVVVVGGGDSAFDCALSLVGVARSVTLVHRSARFKAHERTVAELCASSVELVTRAEVVACHGEPALERVTLRAAGDGGETSRPASLLVVALGTVTRPDPMREWGLVMDGNKIRVGPDMQTSMPGVFAIGDVSTYRGKVPLIVTGFGEAATAVNNAAVRIRPDEELDPGHSSDRPPTTIGAS